MALAWRRPAPLEFWRWHLATETGWTLEYIDGLSLADWHEYWQVTDGKAKAQAALASRAAEAAKARSGRRR